MFQLQRVFFFLSNSGTFFLSNCIGHDSLCAVLSGSEEAGMPWRLFLAEQLQSGA